MAILREEKGAMETRAESVADIAGNQASRLQALLNSEPAYREVLSRVLALCRTPRLAGQIEDEIRSFPEMKVAIHSPTTLLAWLEETGGITCVAMEEGKKGWVVTETGNQVAQARGPQQRLIALLAQSTDSDRATFVHILRFCITPKTRAEIEAMVLAEHVQPDSVPYAAFYVQRLEDAGGLVWKGKWETTQAEKGGIG